MAWGAKITGFTEMPSLFREAVQEGVQLGLEDLGVKGADMVQRNITTPFDGKPPAVAFGNLAASIVSSFQPLPDMAREIIGVSPALHADQYAAPVETGARPHMPPVDALIPWVMKKFDIDNEKQAASTAFAVARKIAERGTAGHLMFDRALGELEPMAVPALEHEIALSLARHGFVETGGAL